MKDRYYFHSMYVRSPGGILVECTANVAGGFYQDESAEELGTRLTLPPWYENQRVDILAMLERVTLPYENQPGRTLRPLVGSTPVGASSAVTLSRSNPDFARYQR